jgi:hypothetical protein
MIRYLRHLSTAGLIAIAVDASIVMGQTLTLTPPPVPPELKVPSGNVPFMKGQAAGTQNYICVPSASGGVWKLFGPQATLFVTFKWFNGEIKQQTMTHFLSLNPEEIGPPPNENGTPRPTWQSSVDTSSVWAKAIASSVDPAYVAPNSIPWLLLEIVGSQPGPNNGSMMMPTTYIQRVNTAAGMAPSTACTVGATLLVPYATDYYFYKSGQ